LVRKDRIGMLLETLQERHLLRGGWGIGGGARTFAREGARVFLAGRTRESLEAVAADIRAAGGSAEVSELDALDDHDQGKVGRTIDRCLTQTIFEKEVGSK